MLNLTTTRWPKAPTADAMPFFDPALRPTISQGDIFSFTPCATIKTPVDVLDASEYIRGKRRAYPYTRWDEASVLDEIKGTGTLSATRAILLTHDCEVDNDARYRTVAPLRLLEQLPAPSQERVRKNRDYRFFHIPQHNGEPEAYVDFRRLTTLAPALIPEQKRLASISDESKKALSLALLLFFTRRVIEMNDV